MLKAILMATCAALAFCGPVWAAGKFESVPEAALEALKAERGKPVRTGAVFVNGHFLKPSYVVARRGTALFVNNEQVTGSVVPWRAFLATQDGAVLPEPKKPVAKKKAEKKPDAAKSEDDLFEDEDEAPAKKPDAAKAPAADAPAADAETAPAPAAFTLNARAKALLKKVKAARTNVDKRLRQGSAIFFGTDYGRVVVDARSARALFAVLPEAIRDANDGADLQSALRTRFPYLSRAVCDDLIAHREDYLALERWRKETRDAERIDALVGRGAR